MTGGVKQSDEVESLFTTQKLAAVQPQHILEQRVPLIPPQIANNYSFNLSQETFHAFIGLFNVLERS